MLVINYNGNKPISNYFKYGVIGNNNVDIVRFVILKQQGYIDLTKSDKCEVRCLNENGEILDSVEIDMSTIEERENMLFVDWKPSKNYTSLGKIEVCLAFSKDSDIWQTQLFTLKFMNGVCEEGD